MEHPTSQPQGEPSRRRSRTDPGSNDIMRHIYGRGNRGSSEQGAHVARPSHVSPVTATSPIEMCLSVYNEPTPGDLGLSEGGGDHERAPKSSFDERNEDMSSFRVNNDHMAESLKTMKVRVKRSELFLFTLTLTICLYFQ